MGDNREDEADEYGEYPGLFDDLEESIGYGEWVSALTKELEEKVEKEERVRNGRRKP